MHAWLLVAVLSACSNGSITGTDASPSDDDSPALQSDTVEVEPVNDAGDDRPPEADPDDGLQVIPVRLPTIPPVALPDISELTETGDVVSAQLGDLVDPGGGVELVSVSCAEGGLQYSGSLSGDDLFAIDEDGSGRYREETEQGLVTLTVDDDGAGRFYDSSGRGLLTIEVEADGSGEYYREAGGGLVTIKVDSAGAGEYYDDRDDQLLTVRLSGDGSGEYYRQADDTLTTVRANGDGTGDYFQQTPESGTVTLEVTDDGGWELNMVESSRRTQLKVTADGSGRYVVSGLNSTEFSFDPEGRAPEAGYRLELPEPPRFSAARRFPPLGKLGSLTPPCATVIRFDSALLFDFGLSELRDDTVELIDQVVAAVEAVGEPIEVVGHTDAIGDDESNLELSIERARAVTDALLAAGMTVDAEVVGKGETEPVAANENPDGSDSPSGRAQNRRVEIIIPETSTPSPAD
jgi:OOP family OmpA-OmpF porin